MKKINTLIILLFGLKVYQINAQTTSASYNIKANPITDRTLLFDYKGAGISKPVEWGLDLAWLDENNIIKGTRFMDRENVSIVRSSFMPTQPLVNGTELQLEALINTDKRIDIIKRNFGNNIKVSLNCDHPSVNSYFYGSPVNWANLIESTTIRHQQAGLNITTVAPFNEPDYPYTGQGSIQDFYNIVSILNTRPRFNNIRISGGNTLNNDEASYWYNYLKPAGLKEGNTHQLAGNFDTYANFFQAVVADGNHATADEMHNVMDAIVGLEYGLNTGIWWGWAEYARGELCKATKGARLGYSEHRPNWTAAAVYRSPQGKVQAFAGTSERQAATTTYRYVSKDKAVYYDGQGPQREFILELPGGAVGSYQNGQTNAERVINVTSGDDIQPVITNGRYKLVNRLSGKVLQVTPTSSSNGANVEQGTYTGGSNQQWDVSPVPARVGGDFSYFTLANVNSNRVLDLYAYQLNNGGNISIWDDYKTAIQQWYFDYSEDGWFYIRSRHSANCVDVAGLSLAEGGNVHQWEKVGGLNQQWRFLPIDAPIEFIAPSVPTNLVATAQQTSVKLTWIASPDADLAGYTIFRVDTAGGEYNTIARNVTTTSFVDNTALTGSTYFYKIKAIDKSLNNSAYSNTVSATPSGTHELVAQYKFDGNSQDDSVNLNHSAVYGNVSYNQGKIGTSAIKLNGTTNFVQLPADIASHKEITVATWVYWNGGNNWQRIFDFGNDTFNYMYLSPKSGGSQKFRFAISNNGSEQIVDADALTPGVWSHVAVTVSASQAKIFVNGVQVGASSFATSSPLDFKPVLNYIGRSQFSDPLFNGNVDEFKVFNYALSNNDISSLYSTNQVLSSPKNELNDSKIVLYKNDGLVHIDAGSIVLKDIQIFDISGRLIAEKKNIKNTITVIKDLKVSNQVLFVKISADGYDNVVTKKVYF